VTKDDVRVAGRCNPLEGFDFSGRKMPLKTLTANFTYTGSQEHSFITGTQRDTFTKIWPDILIGMGRIEQMLYLEQWLSDSQVNLRHQRKTSETSGISFSDGNNYGGDWRFNFFKKYDLSLALNTSRNEDFDLTRSLRINEGESFEWTTQGGRMFGKWRCLLRYSNSESWTKNATGDFTTQLTKNTYTGQVNADMTFPGGLPIPFTKKKLSLTNRLIVTGNIMYSSQSSRLNIQRDNVDNYNIGSNADYEISQNFRFSIGFAWGRTMFRDNPQENFSTIEASSKLNIQF
jgi:hypothetical protein